MFLGSFRPSSEIVLESSGLTLNLFLPSAPTISNYVNLLQTPFGFSLVTSIFVAAAVTTGGLVVCSLAAFALSAIRFRYRELVFAAVVISFAIPGDATAFALLRLARSWGLENNVVGLILPGIGDGIVIFLLRQFFRGIPSELIDAARMDGASWGSILLRVYVPLSKPALIGGALILFITQWQAYLWPLLIISNGALDLAPISLVKEVYGQYTVDYGQMFAGAVILTAVPALVLVPLQRFFVRSSLSGSIKG
jgi:ABC-type glycerol-3-phosphate transport system permease component